MRVLAASEMREADRSTIEELGIPSLVLMENAGRAVATTIQRTIPDPPSHSIAVVCGKGNNGGDGLVVLRTLVHHGYRARAWLLARPDNLSPDARQNFDVATKLGLNVTTLSDEHDFRQALPEIAGSGVIVDAILGTGLTSAARGLAASAVEELNRLDGFKVAVDVPSGLSSDTGGLLGVSFRADLTVALAAPKICHFVTPAATTCGRIEVVDIGIPRRLLDDAAGPVETVDPDTVRNRLGGRRADSHKGDFGHLLVVAGSVGKSGAAVMAARAALRAGAGMVTVASSRSALPQMSPALPEAMWEPLPETPEGAIGQGADARIRDVLEGKSALAIGPGVGRHPQTVETIKKIVQETTVPLVMDADGLNAFQGSAKEIPRGRPIALTPHPGEAARLLDCATSDIQNDRLTAARKLASLVDAHVILKGRGSLVASPNGSIGINLSGNAGMATAGTGDVLTGMLGAFLLTREMEDALRLAVYLHGLAGDLAAAEVGETSLVATDLIRHLPAALRKLGAP